MTETTYLKCVACNHFWPVDSPKCNQQLRELVIQNSMCRCGCTIILHAAYQVRHNNPKSSRAWGNNVQNFKARGKAKPKRHRNQ